ncbi:hypothetical protein QN277_005213 [Acacia crassicarpa]|uniref:BHLH domain-containing protein n=1 Tax=Acacia crassicarpa TaxID=499986 RepID=A0AAE1MAW1_9FABA|nr:hypothetical protein QN277_005213 [Acacia crassicarpa]
MDDDDDFHQDHLLTPASSTFSHLLFGHDHVDPTLHPSSLFSIGNNGTSPKMLCFEGYIPNNQPKLFVSETNAVTVVTPQKSVITSSESSSASSSGKHNSNSNKKRSGSGQQLAGCSESVVTAAGGCGRRNLKKARAQNTATTGHAKRKEKLGERIAALQQLVSPFGKTDTASVLHEATGYIRFLHDQVQVLCSPYLQAPPPSPHSLCNTGDGEEEAKGELSRRGLCLIPVESTLHVASSNGADFWSPAMANNVSSSTRL